MTVTSSVLPTGAGRFNRTGQKEKGVFMKNMILTAMLLAMAILFIGCDKASAQDPKQVQPAAKQTNAPQPQAILVIDEVAYVDGCKGCDCVAEGVCVCEAKADCECCRKNLKKVPAEMQKKCKELKQTQAKKVADCGDCKKDGEETACNDHKKGENDTAKKGK